jgi:hypothetical protein
MKTNIRQKLEANARSFARKFNKEINFILSSDLQFGKWNIYDANIANLDIYAQFGGYIRVMYNHLLTQLTVCR